MDHSRKDHCQKGNVGCHLKIQLFFFNMRARLQEYTKERHREREREGDKGKTGKRRRREGKRERSYLIS